MVKDETVERVRKLEAEVSFDFSAVWAHDLQLRAAGFQKLVAAGMELERAVRLSGLLVSGRGKNEDCSTALRRGGLHVSTGGRAGAFGRRVGGSGGGTIVFAA